MTQILDALNSRFALPGALHFLNGEGGLPVPEWRCKVPMCWRGSQLGPAR
jgi:hypothetical protein